mmetsp:Transcript_1322/g.3952  ORF Transcript_1322/g.3952 Transcript_1322/m.3952 type:complete len:95 (+) Transcript_1322:876-1160(+)
MTEQWLYTMLMQRAAVTEGEVRRAAGRRAESARTRFSGRLTVAAVKFGLEVLRQRLQKHPVPLLQGGDVCGQLNLGPLLIQRHVPCHGHQTLSG